ncbi:MAG TPA: hypothetical protein VGD17_05110, partial [Chitinophagaceae bacterium]
MNILKNVLFIILVLLVLSGLKHLLDRISPASIIFHYNLLTCIQYFIIIALFAWIAAQISSTIFRNRRTRTVIYLFFFVMMLFVEVSFYYLMRDASKVKGRFHDLLTEYYMTYGINFPRLSYDTELSYTLRKNSSYDHDNIEFSNKINVNKEGLRDDEASLVDPEIICLGDSYTMGWGVERDLAFPELLEDNSGLKVLNAGITSFGTARELILLNRLDTSHLKYIILQYCYNDWKENSAFLKNNRYLPVGSQRTQDNTFKSYRLARIYFPFKYSLTILRLYLRDQLQMEKGKDTDVIKPWQHSLDYVGPSADAFLDVLSKSRINFKKVRVLLIDTNRYPDYDH